VAFTLASLLRELSLILQSAIAEVISSSYDQLS